MKLERHRHPSGQALNEPSGTRPCYFARRDFRQTNETPAPARKRIDVAGSGTTAALVTNAMSSRSGAPVPTPDDEIEKPVIVCPEGATKPKNVSAAPFMLSIVAVSVTDPPALKSAIAV